METVVILPAFNLEDTIGDLVRITQKYVDLVIVVTDGSEDNTHSNARAAGAICPSHTCQRGKGFAIRKGIEISKQYDPEYIVLMDADGQHLPKEIPKLVLPLQNSELDMVLGSRVRGILRTSIINRFGNLVLSLISFIITGKWFSDTVSGFKAFKAEKLYGLDLCCLGYEIENELLLKSYFKGYNIIEVPITVPIAIPGIKKTDGIKMAMYNLKNWWYRIKKNNLKKKLISPISLMNKKFLNLKYVKTSLKPREIEEDLEEEVSKEKELIVV